MARREWILLTAIFLFACAETDHSGLSIKLVPTDSPRPLSELFEIPLTDPGSLPTDISDFNCFSVNVTGPDIQLVPGETRGCTSPNNMQGRGYGIFSPIVPLNTPIRMGVLAGRDRFFDAYGIFPSTYTPECGGSGTGSGSIGFGYFLGRAVTEVKSTGTVVRIPISYMSGTSHSVECANKNNEPNEIALIPDGTFMRGKAFYQHAATNCTNDSTSLPSDNSAATFSEFTAAQYAPLTDTDGTGGITFECNKSVPNDAEVILFNWTPGSAGFPNPAVYSQFYFKLKMRGGGHSSPCGGNTPTAATALLQVYNGTWTNVSGVTIPLDPTTELTSTVLNFSSSYIQNTKFSARLVATASYCSILNIEYFKLIFKKP